MDKNQKINCTVHTCEFNSKQGNECTLKQIKVTPTPGNESKTPDESMCSSYKYNN